MPTDTPLPSYNLDIKTPATCQNCRYWVALQRATPEGQPYADMGCRYGLESLLSVRRKFSNGRSRSWTGQVKMNYCVSWTPKREANNGE